MTGILQPEWTILGGGQVILALLIITIFFALGMAVLCGELLIKQADRNGPATELFYKISLALKSSANLAERVKKRRMRSSRSRSPSPIPFPTKREELQRPVLDQFKEPVPRRSEDTFMSMVLRRQVNRVRHQLRELGFRVLLTEILLYLPDSAWAGGNMEERNGLKPQI